MTEIVKYGLLHHKSREILSVSCQDNNGAEDCSGTSYQLTRDSNLPMWLVDTALEAAFVKAFTTPWYNAGYHTPENSFDESELAVIKVYISYSWVSGLPKMPSAEEFVRRKYLDPKMKTHNPAWGNMMLEQLSHPWQQLRPSDKPTAFYTVSDLKTLFENMNAASAMTEQPTVQEPAKKETKE